MDQWVLFNYHNNKIEGNVLTLDDVDWLSRNDSLCKYRMYQLERTNWDCEKHIAEINNGFKAIEYVDELFASGDRITLREIREIQSLVEPNKSGFRVIPVEISGTGVEGSDVKTADAYDIVPYLQSLLDEYYDGIEECGKYDIIKRIAKFHIKFEKIHPFLDGNGRTGRLIMNVQLRRLCANDFIPIIIFKDDVADYYHVLNFKHYNELVALIYYSRYKTRLLLDIYNTNINLGDYVKYLR